MRKYVAFVLACFASFASSLTTAQVHAAGLPEEQQTAKAQSVHRAVPRYFEANRGQWPAEQAYRAYGYGYGIRLGRHGVTLDVADSKATAAKTARDLNGADRSSPARQLSLRFENANSDASLAGMGQLPARGAWFAGEETSWRSEIPLYERVRIGAIYRGIDATFYGHDGQLEYDLDVAAGAKTESLVLDLDGADHAAIAANGDLTIAVNGQQVVLHKPLAWQQKQAVEVSYAMLPASADHTQRVGLKLGKYDASQALTIDPVLTFATYLSSSTSTLPDGYLVDLTVDSANNVYVLSTDAQYSSMTVQKLSPAGALLYTATFASSANTSNNLYPLMIRVNASGQAYIAASDRGNYPTTSTGYQPKYPNASYGGAFNAALSVLSADGSKLIYSTYFGGTANGNYGPDYAFALAVDATGNAYLTGWANGGSFPVTSGALQTQYSSGNQSGFVAKFNPTASGATSLVYSTLLGGQYTYLNGIAVDASGDAYIAVGNYSCQYGIPNTAGAYVYNGGNTNSWCGYVTELNPTGTATVYSSYIGPGTPTTIAVDASQNAYVAGGALQGVDFPTTSGAYQVNYPDGFVAELNTTGGLIYSTFLGGPSSLANGGKVYPTSIGLVPGCTSTCTAYVSGQTFAADFPVVNGLSGPPPGVGQGNNYAAFLAVLNGAGSAALTSGYLNGLSSFQEVYANGTATAGYGSSSAYTPHVAVDSLGNAWLGGSIYAYSGTPDFPVTTPSLAGPNGSWLAEVSMANAGTVVAVPNIVSFGNTVPVNVNSTAATGTPTSISLRNLGSAPVTLSAVVASPSVFTESDDCNGVIPASSYCTAQIAFTPTTDAAINGTLSITSNGVNSPLTIPLTGQGSDTGYIQVSPTSLNFGNQTVNTVSSPQTVTFTNIGDEPVNYVGYEYVSAGYNLLTNCPAVLPPGSSCQGQVTFTPSTNQVGQVTGMLQNNYNGIQQVTLSGIGVLPAGSGGTQLLTLSGTTLNFGTQTVGTGTGAQYVYITNSGTQSVNILVPTLTLTSAQGSTADFQVSSFGSINLTPTANINFYVTFTPSTTAMETATLTIPIAGSSTSYTVTLVGQGAASTQMLELEPGNIVFPDQVVGTSGGVQYFNLLNSGSSPMLVNRIVASGDFSIYTSSCPNYSIPGATAPGYLSAGGCQIGVFFTPTQSGVRTGAVTIYTSSSTTPQVFALTGSGIPATGSLAVSPLLLPFGTQIKGTTSVQQVIGIVNQGNSNVTLNSLSTTGDYAINQAASNCGTLPTVFNPGSVCQVQVTFTPTVASGADNGTLVINSSAGVQTVSLTGAGEAATLSASLWPTTVNMGSNVVQTSTNSVPVYVVNTGTDPLKITGTAAVTGNFSTGGADYCNNVTLAAGQDCIVWVYFTPTATGTRTGTLTVKTAAGNLVVSLSGTGTAASAGTPTLFIPAMGTFDQQAVNTVSAPQTISFYYSGSNPSFALNGASITAGSANFQVTTGVNAFNTCSANLGSTTSCQVNVSYAPTGAGLQTGTLTINSSIGTFAIPLTGYSPALSDSGYLTPGSLNFGSQVVTSASGSSYVTLTNTGASAFTVGTVAGTNFGTSGEFQVSPYAENCSGATLASPDAQNGTPGSCLVNIQFAPSSAGARTGVLSIPVTYADGTTGSFTANLTGTGVAQKNEAVLSSTSASFPDTVVGQGSTSNASYIILTNSGNLPFSIGTLTGTDAIVGNSKTGDFTTAGNDSCSSLSITPGGACGVYVSFQPNSTGAKTGSITFPVTYANATTVTPIVVTLAGKAVASAPSIVITPTAVQFGVATAGTVSNNPQYISVNNTGNVPIVISKYTLSTNFTMTSDSCSGQTIYPGGGCPFYVSFSPSTSTAGTTVTGTLTVTDTSTGSTHTAALTGVSIATSNELGFSQTQLAFGNQLVKTASATSTLYLINQGSKTVKVNTIALGGTNKGDFTESDNCAGAALSAYTGCYVYLTFTPAAAGLRTATLTETDSGSGGPRSVTLSGLGTTAGAAVTLFPSTLTFNAQQNVGEGSAQQFFSVTSTGANQVVITGIASSDTVEFPVTQDGCTGQTLQQGQTCNVGILFAPTATGSHTGTISVTDNATGSPQTVTLNGGGAAKLTSSVTVVANPTSAAFGSLFTLTASVKDQNSKPVTNGSVTFYDGTTALGSVQIVSSIAGGQTIGTATLKTILIPLGANSITAKYTGADAASTSTPAVVSVTGTYPTTTTFTSSGTAGNYTFTGTVQGAGPIAPTGNILFTDTTTGLMPGTAAINASTLAQSFVAAPIINGLAAPQVLALADLNGDGIADLVTGLQSGISVQLGNGDGTFQAPQFSLNNDTFQIVLGDFNQDGIVDMAIASNAGIGIALGQGNGKFQQTVSVYDGGSDAYGEGAGDFNGDGILDLVVANVGQGTIDLLLGNGDGTFQQPTTVSTSSAGGIFNLTVADFNGDGKLDVVFANPSGNTVNALLGNGNGTFQAVKSTATVNNYPQWVATADFNGDGKLDLLVNANSATLGIFLGNGDGTFQTEQTVVQGGYYNNSPAIGDVNGDGKLDFVMGDYYNNKVDVVLGKGDGTFQNLFPYPTGLYPSEVVLSDINRDGRLDFVVANNQGNSDTVFLNRAVQTATLTHTLLPGTGTHAATASYSGDTSFTTSTSTALQLTASLVTPVMQLAAQPSATVAWAQQLSVGVTLTGPYTWVPAPTGTVSYSIDGGTAQAVTVSSGVVIIPIAQLSVGSHSIAVSYGGDQYYATLASQTLAITITKASQTISFPQLPTVTYGASPITLAATATSSLPVTFTLKSGPATLVNGVLTITGAGTISLEADQTGNIDYFAASAATQSFVVSPAPLTITVNPASKVYGAALSTFSGTVSGILNNDAITVTYKSTGTAASGVGTYPITATIAGTAAANYTVTNTPGTLTVTKAALTLTANNLSTTYGATLPSLTYTTTGLVNGDTASKAFTGAPLLATTATAKSSAGTYPISIAAGTLTSTNYAVQYVSGTLTVNTAVLTVTPTSLSTTYGSALPTLTYALSGFVNGDTAAAATTGCSQPHHYSNSYLACRPVRHYRHPGDSRGNKLIPFQFVNGSLTISKATLTLTATNISIRYGSTLPTPVYTVQGLVGADTISTATTGAPSLTTTATATSSVGTYPITIAAGTLVSANYSLVFVPGTVTITAAPLTVAANSASSTYGSALPTLGYTITGFVNGDTAATATKGTPGITTTATAQSAVGTYPITAVAGTLTRDELHLQLYRIYADDRQGTTHAYSQQLQRCVRNGVADAYLYTRRLCQWRHGGHGHYRCPCDHDYRDCHINPRCLSHHCSYRYIEGNELHLHTREWHIHTGPRRCSTLPSTALPAATSQLIPR